MVLQGIASEYNNVDPHSTTSDSPTAQQDIWHICWVTPGYVSDKKKLTSGHIALERAELPGPEWWHHCPVPALLLDAICLAPCSYFE